VNELLRYWAFKLCGKGEQENAASDVMTAAADEIERLRTENARLREVLQHADAASDAMTAAATEIERLRKENDRLRNHHKKIWTESYNAMLAGEVKP